jgi:hypothetical protein
VERRPEERDSGTADRRFARRAIALGTNLAVGMVAFSLGGYWLDARRGGGLLWTLVGMFLGLVYGGYEVWKVVRELERQDRGRQDTARRTGPD